MPWMDPVTLENHRLRLEPVGPSNWDGIAQSATMETFRWYTSWPATFDATGFREWIEARCTGPYLTLAMVDKASGDVVGCSTFFDGNEPNRRLEIGWTWIRKDLRGTWVNPSAKYLMLRHAFEEWGCVRVQLKTDNRNEPSKAAIAKLGAKFEGILRATWILPDGHLRDTAYFSIVASEWPEVKAALEARLG